MPKIYREKKIINLKKNLRNIYDFNNISQSWFVKVLHVYINVYSLEINISHAAFRPMRHGRSYLREHIIQIQCFSEPYVNV